MENTPHRMARSKRPHPTDRAALPTQSNGLSWLHEDLPLPADPRPAPHGRREGPVEKPPEALGPQTGINNHPSTFNNQ